MLDALHTNQATLRQIHQDHGADYLLPVKDNHKKLEALAAQCLPEPAASAAPPTVASPAQAGPFSLGTPRLVPSARPAVRYRRKGRTQQPLPARKAQPALGRHHG